MTDLEILLVDHRIAIQFGAWKAFYTTNTGEARQILLATFRAAEAFDPMVVAEALDKAPEFCTIAAAVADLHTIRRMDDDEALPVLIQMRQSDRPEWLRALAGGEMARRSG
jgi:hypothetical protein